jgi:hypothetical protein
MTAAELNDNNAVLNGPQGHSLNNDPWGFESKSGGKRKLKRDGTKLKTRSISIQKLRRSSGYTRSPSGGTPNKNKRKSRKNKRRTKRTRSRLNR